MFGFDKPEDGSLERFGLRIEQFKIARISPMVHAAWWVVHNVVSHPLIGLLPVKLSFDFHDWTSRKMTPIAPLEK